MSIQKRGTRRSIHSLNYWEKGIVKITTWIMKLWLLTLRVTIPPKEQHLLDSLTQGPKIFAMWHNRLFTGPYFKQRWGKKRRMHGLVSASKDGAWLAEILESVGMGAIRGSSSFRGQVAYKEMLTVLNEGSDVVITPDGPRGPCYDLKVGLVNLVLETRLPLYLLGVYFHKAYRLKSWDGFYVPWPFSRISIFTEKLEPKDLENMSGDLEAMAAGVRERLMTINGPNLRS